MKDNSLIMNVNIFSWSKIKGKFEIPKFFKKTHFYFCIDLQNHQMGWRDPKDDLDPTPYYGQWRVPLDQVAQISIQPGFEQFQEWGIHCFSRQPVPVLHQALSKEFIPSLTQPPSV